MEKCRYTRAADESQANIDRADKALQYLNQRTMSDTPETDHLESGLGTAAQMIHPTLWQFARTLERERNEAREQGEKWEQTACDKLSEICRQIEKTKAMTTQRNDARDALSKISLYLSVGMGDNSTTAHQYYERIIEGIQMLTCPITQMLDKAREDLSAEIKHHMETSAKWNGHHMDLTKVQCDLNKAIRERDRLAEALRMITTFDYADLQCDNGHGARSVATEALQSLNQTNE